MSSADPVETTIVDYQPIHADAWKALNEAWLAEGGFEVEPKDRLVLEDPQGRILDKGGRIFIALHHGDVVGCCALLPMSDGGREVAKMTVTPAARGLGLARRLLQACEDAARDAGAHRLYLETSSTLKSARALYDSFGFQPLPPAPTDYARADVWMEKRL